jgi:hypothetical protein
MSFQDIMSETCYAFSSESIVKCENAMLQILSWNSIVPTSSEILKVLLSASNQCYDFTEIIQKTNKYVFRCLMEYNFTCLKYSSIAMGSLMIALDILGYQNFKQGIISIIEENQISFDIGEIQ